MLCVYLYISLAEPRERHQVFIQTVCARNDGILCLFENKFHSEQIKEGEGRIESFQRSSIQSNRYKYTPETKQWSNVATTQHYTTMAEREKKALKLTSCTWETVISKYGSQIQCYFLFPPRMPCASIHLISTCDGESHIFGRKYFRRGGNLQKHCTDSHISNFSCRSSFAFKFAGFWIRYFNVFMVCCAHFLLLVFSCSFV